MDVPSTTTSINADRFDEKSRLLARFGEDNNDNENLNLFQRIPKRYILTFVAFFGFFNVYALRVCLSVAIEPMQNEYGWSQRQASTVLSSFFWGYLITQLPGGYMASKHGIY
jgi:fucose permease